MGRVQGPSAQLAAQLQRSDCETGRLAGQILLTAQSELFAILQ